MEFDEQTKKFDRNISNGISIVHTISIVLMCTMYIILMMLMVVVVNNVMVSISICVVCAIFCTLSIIKPMIHSHFSQPIQFHFSSIIKTSGLTFAIHTSLPHKWTKIKNFRANISFHQLQYFGLLPEQGDKIGKKQH